jgi:hypothetical protein
MKGGDRSTKDRAGVDFIPFWPGIEGQSWQGELDDEAAEMVCREGSGERCAQ